MSSPNIIYKSKYELAINNVDNKKTFKNYSKDRKKDVEKMVNYFSNPKEKAVGLVDYFTGKINKQNYNLILSNGNYATNNDIKRLKKNFSNYIENSNLWKGVISFNNSYLNENISLEMLEQKFVKNVMPKFLKYCGFKDIKKMDYVCAVHTKSKSGHIHIHFAFAEKTANYVYPNKKVGYRRTGIINAEEKNFLKRLLALEIEREKFYTPLLTKTNEDIDEYKKYFNPNEKNFILKDIDDILIEEKILLLGQLLKQYRQENNNFGYRINYNSIKNNKVGKEIKQITNDIKKYFLSSNNSELQNVKEQVNTDLVKLNIYFNKLNDDLHIKEKIKDIKIITQKKDYVDNYVYNSIVNHALNKYNKIYNNVKSKNKYDKITIEDLIQELAYQNNKKNNFINDKQRKKIILNNYFKGIDNVTKFPNKYKMERAIKNINYEMERASEEFSNLFVYDDKKVL